MALYADPVFADPGAFGALALWLAAVAYALQVYCDFSGYTDMALGLAHLLGYHLAPNFAMPFLAPNLSEFWRRWHMSLSGWIRDYLFIPLGGSRRGAARTCLNLLLCMSLCGLWHGASWNYVLFGVLQGCLLIGHRWFRSWCQSRPALDGALRTDGGTALRVALTFTVFCYSLVLFRCPTLADAGTMMVGMVTGATGFLTPLKARALWWTLAALALGHYLALGGRWKRLAERLPAPAWGFGFGLMLTTTLTLAPDASKAFVYFQF
jgi:alginate O-acetyltransferase complex protein AlgI